MRSPRTGSPRHPWTGRLDRSYRAAAMQRQPLGELEPFEGSSPEAGGSRMEPNESDPIDFSLLRDMDSQRYALCSKYNKDYFYRKWKLQGGLLGIYHLHGHILLSKPEMSDEEVQEHVCRS